MNYQLICASRIETGVQKCKKGEFIFLMKSTNSILVAAEIRRKKKNQANGAIYEISLDSIYYTFTNFFLGIL